MVHRVDWTNSTHPRGSYKNYEATVRGIYLLISPGCGVTRNVSVRSEAGAYNGVGYSEGQDVVSAKKL